MRAVASFDRLSDIGQSRARLVHVHRVTRDVNADGSTHAVRFPPHDVAFGVATRDKAIVVVAVAEVLAPAEARDVVEDLRVLGREGVDRPDDLERPRRRKSRHRERRQIRRRQGPGDRAAGRCLAVGGGRRQRREGRGGTGGRRLCASRRRGTGRRLSRRRHRPDCGGNRRHDHAKNQARRFP